MEEVRNGDLGLGKGCLEGLWTEETVGQRQGWGWGLPRPGLAADPEKDPELLTAPTPERQRIPAKRPGCAGPTPPGLPAVVTGREVQRTVSVPPLALPLPSGRSLQGWALQEKEKTRCLSQLQGQGSFLRSIWRWMKRQRGTELQPGPAGAYGLCVWAGREPHRSTDGDQIHKP